jgi:uncharacterized protein
VRQVILKIHSRCNLACDYCYMYNHVDQGWRGRPTTMPDETVRQVAYRLGEHARRHRLPRLDLVLHGGEPLLAGAGAIDHAIRSIRAELPSHTVAGFAIQTNGVLLDEEFLDVFHRHGVRVGVSIDGDRRANDRHRLFSNGRSSHDGVAAGLELLNQERHRELFAGLLCTIDLRNDPVDTYQSLLRYAPPRLDLLLPHGNWTHRPPGLAGEETATAYADWLSAVFDRWYLAPRRETGIRLFESIMSLLLGGAGDLQMLGLTDLGVLTVETDGSIEGDDALKTTSVEAIRTGLTVFAHSFDQAMAHPSVSGPPPGLQGLCPQCRACPVVRVCGGGLPAHRFRAGSGFEHPSVYCADLLRLITHVRDRLRADLGGGSRREVAAGGRA